MAEAARVFLASRNGKKIEEMRRISASFFGLFEATRTSGTQRLPLHPDEVGAALLREA